MCVCVCVRARVCVRVRVRVCVCVCVCVINLVCMAGVIHVYVDTVFGLYGGGGEGGVCFLTALDVSA